MLLEQIKKFKDVDVLELSKILNIDIDVCYSYCQEMNKEGNIEFIDASNAYRKAAKVEINGKGKVFLDNGGYNKILDKAKKNKQSKSRQKRISNSYKIIQIFTALALVVLGILSYKQNTKINNLQSKIDQSYEQQVKQELIGKWIDTNRVNGVYEFKENNTWIYTNFSNGNMQVYKGEYQIGKEKGVFLRNYGSQHWEHDTTYTDIKSGIGTSYLYLKNGYLINNQEDYINKYKKAK